MFVYILNIIYLSDTNINYDVQYVHKQNLFVYILYVLVNVNITLSPNISLQTHAVYTSKCSIVRYLFISYMEPRCYLLESLLASQETVLCFIFCLLLFFCALINQSRRSSKQSHPNNHAT